MIALVIAVLTAIAIACEVAALQFILDLPQGTDAVLKFFGLHAIASIVFAFVVRATLVPIPMRTPAWAVVGLAACFSLFIPIFGILALIAAVLAVLVSPRALITRPYTSVRHPEFTVPIRESESRMRATGLRTVLLDPTLAPELRLRSLMALQNFPIRRAGPFLRRLLGDPADDIRLTAYSLLERETKRISEIIEQDVAALAVLEEPSMRLVTHRRLAEQHWELVYTGLAQADLADYSLGEALRHLDEALSIAPREPGLWLLRGRLLNARGDVEGGGLAYREAVRCGLPAERAAPWLAELAYRERNHAEVRAQMSMVDVETVGPTVGPVARFWRARIKTHRTREPQ
ncbi:MAG: hypothetical protein ACKVQU_05735 [Burkholderiales bacterium]